MIRSAIRIVVAAALLVLLVRTFLLLGLVVPLEVQGSSMAPTVRGSHLLMICPNCSQQTRVGADQLPTTGELPCPACTDATLRIADATPVPGDQLLVDRTRSRWRSLQRWDSVVLRQPDEAQRFCVKRLLGLPGESIRLLSGDLYVDGKLARKTLDEQLRLRVLVHQDAESATRWRPEAGDWTLVDETWSADDGERPAALVYGVPGGELIDDGLAYNGRVSRRLNPVRDLMVTFSLRWEAHSRCSLTIQQGDQRVMALLDASTSKGQLMIEEGDRRRLSVSADSPLLGAPGLRGRDSLAVTFSLFDRQALLALDDQTLLVAPLREGDADPSLATIRITKEQGPAEVSNLCLWRDVYYENRPRDHACDDPQGWRLGHREGLVIGDNQAISHDSRNWSPGPGAPERLLVGRVTPAR